MLLHVCAVVAQSACATHVALCVCRSTEFAVSHDEIEQEFHRRLQQQLQQRKAEQPLQQQQQQTAVSNRSSRYSCSLAPIPSCSDLSCSARQGSSGDYVTDSKSNTKSNKAADDLEAVRQQLLAERHYVPAVELFRKHWGALLLQCGYEACVLNCSMLPWRCQICYCARNSTESIKF
jgi:hypothetical protein